MLIKNDKPLVAISYDTQTFNQLRKFINDETGLDLDRVEPNEFFKNPDPEYQYINLVIKDFDQRKQVSAVLDQNDLDRFTYVGNELGTAKFHFEKFKFDGISIGKGCLIFPGVWAYSGSIGNDVILHSMTKLAENVRIGNGSFLSGSITVAGGCTIGDWCFLGNNLFFIDGVHVCNDVKLLPGTNLRKSISEPGTYYNPNTYRVEKIML